MIHGVVWSLEPQGQCERPSSSTHRAMKPGTSETSESLSRPSARRFASAASPRCTTAGIHWPVNIAPFSTGVHQPIALGNARAASSGVGIGPT